MKKILCGREQGYLIPWKEFDSKFKERFIVLQDTFIKRIKTMSPNMFLIEYVDDKSFEKIEEGVYKEILSPSKNLIIDNNKLVDIFGIKENVIYIHARYFIKDDKFIPSGWSELYEGLRSMDKLYCFFEIQDGEPYHESIVEIK